MRRHRFGLKLLTGLVGLAAPSATFASEKDQLCQGAGGFLANGTHCTSNLSNHLTNHVQNITDTLLLVAGAVAVIIIIIAGIRFVTSTGDSARIEQAKNTLLYAVIGLVVVIVAYAIVHFVAGNV